ncbi:ATP-binding cassette domain-containing protein [Nesterenkonia sp. F]|uniref:ABC transporter ATP-binding protein n=1 Tax=Nesterenkonia sp. F TaxID=795955 RepID=UPI000255D3B2|nr:ATP-binding cassette domain-containing protein [Nesterenkonia sp. F]
MEIAGTALLDPVDLEVPRGTLWSVRGPNGSGKSTLLRLLAGRAVDGADRCRVLGRRPDDAEPAFRAAVASFVDAPPIARDLTILEQVAVVDASWHGDGDAAVDRASRLLERLTLGELQTRFPHELSAGQLQLTGLALVLARPAELLLLDEPERHLDPDRAEVVAGLVDERVAQGTTALVAAHDPRMVASAVGEVRLDR